MEKEGEETGKFEEINGGEAGVYSSKKKRLLKHKYSSNLS